MNRNKKILLFVLILVVLLVLGLILFRNHFQTTPKLTETTTTTTSIIYSSTTLGKEIKIASWNLQRFGLEKANNPALMNYYVSKLGNYDIIILLEITDSTGQAFNKLCGEMKGYSCIESKREGNSSYKEQYGILYKGVTLSQVIDRTDSQASAFVRPPYSLDFKTGEWSFRLTTIHTDPDRVKPELSNLEKLTYQDNHNGDEIIIGDLNADCSYYQTPPTDFTSWKWIIPDKEDTTVKNTNCAYDRIIINKQAENNYENYGVMRDVNANQSDHDLIYATFRTDHKLNDPG